MGRRGKEERKKASQNGGETKSKIQSRGNINKKRKRNSYPCWWGWLVEALAGTTMIQPASHDDDDNDDDD